MGLRDQVLQQFNDKQQLYFGVPVNADAHFITVYTNNDGNTLIGDMLISGKGRDVPPFLLLRPGQMWMSASGKRDDWHNFTNEPGDFAVFALLDPRRVIQAAARITEPDGAEVGLLQLLRGTAEAANVVGVGASATQRVVFKLDQRGIVTQMVQNDITRSREAVTISFVTKRPYDLPSYDLPPP